MNTRSLGQAIDQIVSTENFNTDPQHYMKEYDVALHVIFGLPLYEGAELCARRAQEDDL